MASEADMVRAALADDPLVSNEDYGRLVEEAAEADEIAALDAEIGELE
jgi:CTP:molybdopterin cytidylyltransferase MocA